MALAVASTATLPGLARLLEKADPQAASLINPFNTDARVRAISRELTTATSPAELVRLEEEVTRGLIADRLDARLYSMLGEVKRLQGDEAAARQHVAQSRRLSKTEIRALERSIDWALKDGRIADAVADIDTLLRRWPSRFEQVSKAFPALLSDPTGFTAIATALRDGAPWRRSLFRALGADRQGLPAGERLLSELRQSPDASEPVEISAIISGYIREQDFQSAHRLFLFSLTDDERKYDGYVYNPTFAPVSLKRPFDWAAHERAGVEVILPSESTSGQAEHGARVRFLNAPLRDSGLQQSLLLPPGAYRISTTVSGRSLKLPKGLFWSVSCRGRTNRDLARLELPEGSFEHRRIVADFVVPAQGGCEIQLLHLVTGMIAESFRFRYQGVLSIHEVRIEKVAA
jgi:hypothetical protein